MNALVRFLGYQIAAWFALALVARGLGWAGPFIVGLLALYTTIPLLLFVRWRGWPFYPGAAFRLLVVRALLYTQLMLPFVAAGAVIGMLIGLPLGMSMVIGRALSGAIIGAGALVLLAGYVGSRRLVVREVEARVRGLPMAFDGVRIAQISDLHVGPQTSRRFLRRVAQTVSGAGPDIIAVTGDVVDDRSEDVPWYAAAFATLRAPLGVYLIPGNHDGERSHAGSPCDSGQPRHLRWLGRRIAVAPPEYGGDDSRERLAARRTPRLTARDRRHRRSCRRHAPGKGA